MIVTASLGDWDDARDFAEAMVDTEGVEVTSFCWLREPGLSIFRIHHFSNETGLDPVRLGAESRVPDADLDDLFGPQWWAPIVEILLDRLSDAAK